MEIDHAGDLLERLLDLFRLLPQDRQVGAEDAHDDRIRGARQHLPDPLFQVRLDVAPDPRIPVDDLLDRLARLAVVDGRVDADPVLAKVDTDDLVREQSLADVGAAVADSGDRAQLDARCRGDADLFLVGRPRCGHPVHEKVALLEVGQE
jgi:hypothetical protein